MGWTTDVIEQAKLTGGAIQSLSPRAIASQQQQSWNITVKDDGGGFVPSDVTEADLLRVLGGVAGFPVINETPLQWTAQGGTTYVIPWLLASNKRAERDRQNSLVWRAIVDYRTPNLTDIREDDLQAYDISSLPSVADYPFLVETRWGEDTKVLYEEARTGGQKELRLPTGNLFSEPFRRRYPARRIVQWQFEQIDEANLQQTIRDRMLTTNNIAFMGDPAPGSPDQEGSQPPRWLIIGINYQKVSIPLAAGSASGYLMAYTIERNDKDGGWWDRRALVDTHYLEEANDLTKKKAYRDPSDQVTVIPCLLNEDGTLKDDQAGPLTFKNFVQQPEGIWSFLRT